MNGDGVVSGAAWREVCERLAAMGEEILGDGWPDDEQGRVEGARHLATQVACWFTYATGYSDPERPAFFRSADPTYAWGGPNVDQVARRAAIDGAGAYRVSGRMGACEEFVLQIKGGTTQSGGAEIADEITASKLGLAPGDTFDIALGGEERSGAWLPLAAGPGFVHVRDYYFDWVAAEPATFVIERLDTQGRSAPAVSAERVAQMLETAVQEVEHSSVYFRDLQARMRAAQTPNQFGVPDVSGRGVQDIIYSHGFVSLADNEALVLELDPEAAALWGVSSYTPAWYEPLDYATARDQPQPPAGHRGFRRTRAGRARGNRHRHRQLARLGRSARPAHHRALVPTPGTAADPQRGRAARRARRPPARRPSARRPRLARRRAPRPRRARVVEVPDVSATDPNSVDGHVVIVTGGSKGVGRGIALHLAHHGARVVITARRQDALDEVSAELTALGAPHLATTLNVADREGAFALVEQAVAEFGTVDALVANAQTFRSVTPFAEITEHDMDVLLDTGPKGTLWGMQAVYPHMQERGRGRIVTMGSNAALLGAVGYAPYASSKEAIRALTRSAAREWGKFGITVNCLCPVSAAHRVPPSDEDPVRAKMFAETYANQPIPRDGDAVDDIGPVVQFLVSDASRYMTGQTLMADGGAIMLI